jgi:uncharacterized membrane protein
MPQVITSIQINAPLDQVYAVAKDNRSFPEFMEDVDSLVVVSEEAGTVISDWVGRVPAFGLKVRWTQEDAWDDTNYTCRFHQVKGDYDMMEGTWKFVAEGDQTRFDSTLDYEYSVPGLGPIVGKVIYGLVVKNMEGVLAAIKHRAESQGALN